MSRARKQPKDERRARRRRVVERRRPPGLDYTDPLAPLLLMADVGEAMPTEDGTVAPWGAVVEVVDRPELRKEIAAETLPGLFVAVQRIQEGMSDELDRSVGTLWTLNGDPDAWRALVADQGLDRHFTARTIAMDGGWRGPVDAE